MNIETLMEVKPAGEAVKALYGMEANEKMLQLQKTRSEFEGNLTLVVFPFVKRSQEITRADGSGDWSASGL